MPLRHELFRMQPTGIGSIDFGFHASILTPASLIMARTRGTLFTKGDGANAISIYPKITNGLLHRIRASLAQSQVVLVGASLIAVALKADRAAGCVQTLGQRPRCIQGSRGQYIFVEVEEDGSHVASSLATAGATSLPRTTAGAVSTLNVRNTIACYTALPGRTCVLVIAAGGAGTGFTRQPAFGAWAIEIANTASWLLFATKGGRTLLARLAAIRGDATLATCTVYAQLTLLFAVVVRVTIRVFGSAAAQQDR